MNSRGAGIGDVERCVPSQLLLDTEIPLGGIAKGSIGYVGGDAVTKRVLLVECLVVAWPD